MSTLFDPYRAQTALLWRNRVQRWRQQRAQTVFHAAALAALIALLFLPARDVADGAGAALLDALRRWPLPMLMLVVAAMTLRHAQRLAALRVRAAGEWLATQPVAERLRRRRRHDLLLRDAALHGLVGVVSLLAIDADASTIGAFLAGAFASVVLAPILSRFVRNKNQVNGYYGSRIAERGRGRLWRWQRIVAGIALRGRTLGLGGFALLLLPMQSGPLAIVVMLAVGLSVAALTGAWRRSLAVVPAAQVWLGAQPLTGRDLLVGVMSVPAALLAIFTSLVGLMFVLLGVPAIGAFAALAIFAVGALQFACVAAERATPHRIQLVFVVHLALLLGIAQAFAPAAAICWLLQMVFLLRRAARS